MNEKEPYITSGYYACYGGCGAFYPPEKLKVVEITSIILGESHFVTLCPKCLEQYQRADVVLEEPAEVKG